MIDLANTTRLFLLPEELAEILLVSRRTVSRWIEENRIAALKVAGTRRIPVDEARRLLNVRFSKPNPPKPHAVA